MSDFHESGVGFLLMCLLNVSSGQNCYSLEFDVHLKPSPFQLFCCMLAMLLRTPAAAVPHRGAAKCVRLLHTASLCSGNLLHISQCVLDPIQD